MIVGSRDKDHMIRRLVLLILFRTFYEWPVLSPAAELLLFEAPHFFAEQCSALREALFEY